MDMIPREDNIGGIHAAFIKLNGSFTFPYLGKATSISQSILEQMDQIPIHPFRATYNSTASENDQGVLHSKTFDTGIPSDHELVRDLVEKHQGKEVVLVIQDLDFQYWLICDREEPGKFLSDFSTGTQPTDGKNHSISITCIGRNPRAKLTVT